METVSATVQYGDFRGEAAADNVDDAIDDIHALARAHKVKGHVVGVSLWSGETGEPRISVYTTDTISFDDVEAEAQANEGKLKVKRHVLEKVTVSDLLKVFKRFNVVLRYRFSSVRVMEYDT